MFLARKDSNLPLEGVRSLELCCIAQSLADQGHVMRYTTCLAHDHPEYPEESFLIFFY